MVRDKDAAEDIVQEVFIRFWNKKEDLPKDLDPKAYLFKSVSNASLNFIAEQKKSTKVESEILINVEANEKADGEILHQETVEAIRLGLEELPPACKNVFLLSRNEDLSYKEIADTLDISIKTVEAQMSKALRILRKYLKPFLSISILIIWSIFLKF